MCAAHLDLTYHGRPSRFSVRPIDRARLLGATRRIALDAHGNECETAWLTRDGQYLLHAGSFADLYVNERGDSVERREFVPVDREGRPLAIQRSTRGDAQDLWTPVPAEELLDHVVTRVYFLGADALDPELESALREGRVFRVAYRPRKTAHPTPAFLLANALGTFLLQAEPCGFAFVGLEQSVPVDAGGHEGDGTDAEGLEPWWGDADDAEGGLFDAA
jgi:hypothetical protein